MIYNLVLNITAARHTNIFTEALFSITDFRLQVGFVGHESSIVQNCGVSEIHERPAGDGEI